MNTRLQVEHPVTEIVSEIDIVGEQFRIAGGADISGLVAGSNGYAIEARINAERAVKDGDGKIIFKPDPGTFEACEFPERDDVQIISSMATGKTVPPFYDSLIAQIIVHGSDRNDAIERLSTYLRSVEITGIATNIPILLRILRDEVFIGGIYDTEYLPGLFERIDLDELVADIAASAGGGTKIDGAAIAIADSDELKVLCPSTGIFYISPSPTEPEFVAEGSIVGVNDTICLLEAMKVFSPLRLADFNRDGGVLYDPDLKFQVMRVNIGSAQQVSSGDLLLVVKPVT